MNTATQALRPDLEPLPQRLLKLPLDERGYPVPWFVAWVEGKPEFRAADGHKLRQAIHDRRCWVCGEQLGVRMTFVVGPMCGINRTAAEPPSHKECAVWSARNCPFLSNAGRRRREDEAINEETISANVPGLAITRNPGVVLLWTTRKYSLFRDVRGGVLIKIGDPEEVLFFAEGKPATREQVVASVESGIPALKQLAELDGPEGLAELDRFKARFEKLYPKP